MVGSKCASGQICQNGVERSRVVASGIFEKLKAESGWLPGLHGSDAVGSGDERERDKQKGDVVDCINRDRNGGYQRGAKPSNLASVQTRQRVQLVGTKLSAACSTKCKGSSLSTLVHVHIILIRIKANRFSIE
jgi:hypothetical protein